MRTTPQTLSLLKWLAALPPTIWWHLGETSLWVETPTTGDLPPLPPGLSIPIKWVDPIGNISHPT